ncbi:MAG: sigma-54 dependent transcriptional regulator [Hyphomonas sp.]
MRSDKIRKIIAADKQPSMLRLYERWCQANGHTLESVSEFGDVLSALEDESFEFLLLDSSICPEPLSHSLNQIRKYQPDIFIIAVSENGTISDAVESMRAGCQDYLIKPVSIQKLESVLAAPPLSPSLIRAKSQTRKSTSGQLSFVGSSPTIQRVQILASTFGRSTAPVMITGESGTGKEVCAKAIHNSSERADRPFIAINCAALPKELMESELFGHTKGAFSGALNERTGAAQSAHGGTLFLDEVGEMDFALQAKLLRFIQTGEIKKVGSDKTQTVDARIICATNRNLPAEIKAGTFREDLFYRLNVLSILMPPLRERGNDIVELAHYFYEKFIELEGADNLGLTKSAILALVEHDWPGNVRELENTIRRGVVLSGGKALDASALLGIDGYHNSSHPLSDGSTAPQAPAAAATKLIVDLNRPLEEIERDIVEKVIQLHFGSLPKAAASLRLSPSTLYRKRAAWLPGTEAGSSETEEGDEQSPFRSAS